MTDKFGKVSKGMTLAAAFEQARLKAESVVLVAHGPNNEEANRHWLEMLRSFADRLKAKGSFRVVKGLTLREDAPKKVRARATRDLRATVKELNKLGTA